MARYTVTITAPGITGKETHRRKQSALESAQSHALKGRSAEVTPRLSRTMILEGQRVSSIRYFLDAYGWQFITA